MLKKLQKTAIAITLATIGASCTTTSSKNLKTLNTAIDQAKQIDSFYLTLCNVPGQIESDEANLDEVATVYFSVLNDYLECYHKHKNLVEQIKIKP